MKRYGLPILGLVLVLATGGLLITAHPSLLVPLVKQPYLPLGNVLTWASLVTLPYLVKVALLRVGGIPYLSRLVYALLLSVLSIGGLLWGLVGRQLSGNWSNSFRNIPFKSEQFWGYTYFLLYGVAAVLILYVLQRLTIAFAPSRRIPEE